MARPITIADLPKHQSWRYPLPDLRGINDYAPGETLQLEQQIKELLKRENAVLVAHYYTDASLQRIAEETGGIVADSLEMARFGHLHSATTVIVAGVRFMGETAKILNPEKRILMPTLEAECSLDLGCPAEEFIPFCDQHPDRTVVVYANTSAAVKARADWVVTSSIAVDVAQYLAAHGEEIIWGPDKYLGDYVCRLTGVDALIWEGSCIVHEAFKSIEIEKLRNKYPDAAVLVHPESPPSMIDQADFVGSTTQLIKAAVELSNTTLIVATDHGIFYKMQQAVPDKILIEAPTAGTGATCRSCAHCPWMAMNDLRNLAHVLETGNNEIEIAEPIRRAALQSTNRMLEFSAAHCHQPRLR